VALRRSEIGKITKNFALLDRLQNLAEFLHGLGGLRTLAERQEPAK
jgi:hypothetical protein